MFNGCSYIPNLSGVVYKQWQSYVVRASVLCIYIPCIYRDKSCKCTCCSILYSNTHFDPVTSRIREVWHLFLSWTLKKLSRLWLKMQSQFSRHGCVQSRSVFISDVARRIGRHSHRSHSHRGQLLANLGLQRHNPHSSSFLPVPCSCRSSTEPCTSPR